MKSSGILPSATWHATRTRVRLADWAGAAQRRVPGSVVALTFDDGPDPVWTPRVLDVLKSAGVVATFFCVGDKARRHPDLVQRIRAEGHSIGSHSDSHRVDGGRAPLRALDDFIAGRRAVETSARSRVPLFRPPHGRLGVWLALRCRRLGFQTWQWSVDAADWTPGLTAAEILERLTTRVQGGDVILLHDSIEEPLAPEALDRSALVEALPALVEWVRGRGLEFVPLR